MKGSSVIACRLSIPLPEDYPTYHGALARKHPELEFLVLERMVLDEKRMVEDVRISGATDDGLIDEFRAGKGILKVQLLERTKDSAVVRVEIELTPFILMLKDLRMLARPPFPFTRGIGTVLVIADREKIHSLLKRLQEYSPEASVESIHSETIDGHKSLLTPRQFEVFKTAMSAGYWDIPRRAHLADIAALSNVSKSTVAETLATIEKKLLFELRGQQLARPEMWFSRPT